MSCLVGTLCGIHETIEPFYIENYVVLQKWTPHNSEQREERALEIATI